MKTKVNLIEVLRRLAEVLGGEIWWECCGFALQQLEINLEMMELGSLILNEKLGKILYQGGPAFILSFFSFIVFIESVKRT
jgi:hypothetical protein